MTSLLMPPDHEYPVHCLASVFCRSLRGWQKRYTSPSNRRSSSLSIHRIPSSVAKRIPLGAASTTSPTGWFLRRSSSGRMSTSDTCREAVAIRHRHARIASDAEVMAPFDYLRECCDSILRRSVAASDVILALLHDVEQLNGDIALSFAPVRSHRFPSLSSKERGGICLTYSAYS